MDEQTRNESSQVITNHVTDSVLSTCCSETIRIHARNNPMMVCPQCKKIIKCFPDEGGHRNYVKFCKSRNRDFLTTKYEDFFVVIFKNYDSFGS